MDEARELLLLLPVLYFCYFLSYMLYFVTLLIGQVPLVRYVTVGT